MSLLFRFGVFVALAGVLSFLFARFPDRPPRTPIDLRPPALPAQALPVGRMDASLLETLPAAGFSSGKAAP